MSFVLDLIICAFISVIVSVGLYKAINRLDSE